MNNLNWPTALVIISIIFAAAFIYNKPIDAGFGSDGGMISTASETYVWQINDGKIRQCYNNNWSNQRGPFNNLSVICTPWTD